MPVPAALITEKNKISNTSPWLILLDIVLTGSVTLRLTSNLTLVSFGGNDYSPFPMQIQHVSQSISGDIPEINIAVSNADRVIQGYIEALDGAVDCEVVMYIVHQGNLAADYADLTRNFKILSTVCTNEWITFSLGLMSPTYMRFPLFRTMGSHCNWLFKGAECGYAGLTDSCDHTLKTCQDLQGHVTVDGVRLGATPFGGFPGLNSAGVKFV
jgi:lambda family phage minor tail protein L